ncbi:DUF3325 domain-containing protein [Isoalcanivorax beigongshangi]|uniref:DUF3325 domain-containing protein n=1 Tax=Isoalcanivorax beigongshangi TaxID=3238810 RepID=A0ABV4AE03_9GAMM
MKLLLCWCLAAAGFIALSLPLGRHAQNALGRPLSVGQGRLLRVVGALAIALATVPAMQHWGISVGLAVWSLVITGAALLPMALLTYRPRALAPTGWGHGLAAAVLWLLA